MFFFGRRSAFRSSDSLGRGFILKKEEAQSPSGPEYLLDYSLSQFTRSSAGTLWDASSQTLLEFNNNEPRIDSDGKILIEANSGNYLLWSEYFDRWTAATGSQVTSSYGADPAGNQNTGFINFSTDPDSRIYSVLNGGISKNQSASISYFYRSVVQDTFASQFNDWDGNPVEFTSSNSGSTWIRDRRVTHSAGGLITPEMIFKNGLALANGMELFGVQVEASRFPTSYIRTSGSVQFRSIDICTLDTLPEEMQSGSWVVDLYPNGSSDEMLTYGIDQHIFHASGSNNNLRIRSTGGNVFFNFKNSTGHEVSSNNLTFPYGAKLRVTINHELGTIEISGATTGNGIRTSGNPPIYWPSGLVKVGCSLNNNQVFYGMISRPWKSGTL